MKKIFFLLFFLFFLKTGFTQKNTRDSEKGLTEKFSIAVDIGMPILGYAHVLEDAFLDQEFNADSNEAIYFGISASYAMNKRNEIGAYLGILTNANKPRVEAFKDRGIFIFKYDEASFTPFYRYSVPGAFLKLEAGLSANNLHVKRINNPSNLDNNDTYKWFRPGVMIGAQVRLLEIQNFYLRGCGQFHALLGKEDFGPFSTQYSTGEWNEVTQMIDYTYHTEQTFDKERLQFSKFLIFISFGVDL